MSRLDTLGSHFGSSRSYLADINERLIEPKCIYPNFDSWFWLKVVPELGCSRSIFIEWSGSFLAGLVIAKNGPDEKKLCTIWIPPAFRALGIATRLVAEATEWMGTDHPMITIPEHRLDEFRGILSSRDFVATQRLESYYQPGQTEHVFNGRFPTRGHLPTISES